MKTVDAILILLILGIGGAALIQSNRSRNCRDGQVQLTPEVKAMIDKELANPIASASAGEPAGLAGVLAQASATEKELEAVQTLAKQYTQLFRDQVNALRTLQNRERDVENDRIKLTETLTKKVINSCSKRRPGKF